MPAVAEPASSQNRDCRVDLTEAAVAQLLNLYDGESGVLDLLLYGHRAIPALRAFLFRRDRSGIYQPRRWAIEVLAGLGAFDVLRDYLLTSHDATDPVERAGDEAVINAAARAISKVREDWVFQLLLDLASQRISSGPIEALGNFDRLEAIPTLIAALAEDDCRSIAEACLQRLGDAAQPALVRTALERRPSALNESETSLRRRRSALHVLTELQTAHLDSQMLRELVADRDNRIAVLACKLCLASGSAAAKALAVQRLKQIADDADWILGMEIERLLRECAERAPSKSSGRPRVPTVGQ
jgi:hypothetical protein